MAADKKPSLLLKEIKQDEAGTYVAVVQVPGRPVFFPSRVKELVKDEKLLVQFPPAQIKTLVTLFCNEEFSKSEFRISAVDFESSNFIVQEVSTGKYSNLTMDEINEPYLLDNFSKKDIFKIGMMYGEYKANLDHENAREMRQLDLNVIVGKFK
jgi:hypothetical protein